MEKLLLDLLTHHGIKDLVGERISPLVREASSDGDSNIDYPAIVYEKKNAGGSGVLDSNEITNSTFQVEAWGVSYSSIKAIEEALINMNDFSGYIGEYVQLVDVSFAEEDLEPKTDRYVVAFLIEIMV